jgi:hypothetical protein
VIGPVIDDVMTTRPCPDAVSAGRQAWTASIVPLTFVASTRSISDSGRSASMPSGKIPAFAHRTSTPPWRSCAAAAIAAHPADVATSAANAETVPAPPNRPASSAAHAAAAAASRPTTSTFAPAAANTPAIPFPMPREPPVTTTERPVTSKAAISRPLSRTQLNSVR